MKKIMLKVVSMGVTVFSMLFALSFTTLATNTGMPWEGPMDQILGSITGPVAKFVAVIAIVSTGLGFALADEGHFLKKAMGIVFGLSVAFGAVSWVLPLLGFTGGVAF